MHEIQSKLKNICLDIGNVRLAVELLRKNQRFSTKLGHATLVRWLNQKNPSLRIIHKMELAVAILEKKRPKTWIKNPYKEMILEALEDNASVRRTLKALLKSFDIEGG